jgi:hypothetical protein
MLLKTMKHLMEGKAKARPRRSAVGAAPAYEECLIQILDSIDVNDKTSEGRLHSEKQKLKHFDSQPHRLSLPAYRRLIVNLVDRNLNAHLALQAAQPLLKEELRAFLERYEHLMMALRVGYANSRQVRWVLCTRFFVPWAALRIAFHLRHRQSQPCGAEYFWFLPPVKQDKIGSCFMQILDRRVRNERETEEALAHRLCGKQEANSQSDVAINLCRDLRRYRAGEGTPSGAKITQILHSVPPVTDLHTSMVLARAIDYNVQEAIKQFGHNQALKLVRFFTLTFHHFRLLLQRLATDLPSEDKGAWLYLQSRTFTGNTPFEAERFYPLTEPYLHELAKKISAELESVKRTGRLSRVPAKESDFKQGAFAKLDYKPLPIQVESAMQKVDFAAAVAASRSLFPHESSRAAEAVRLADFFSCIGLAAFDTGKPGTGLIPSEAEGAQVLREAIRLLQLAYARSRSTIKAKIGIKLLRLLLRPQRPKLKAERRLARKLFQLAEEFYRKSNRCGSARFLQGCLLWLEGKKRRALGELRKAAACGRASCGEDWIALLGYAPILAEELSQKHDLNYFRKIAEHEGVTNGEPSPRTARLLRELNRYVELNKIKVTFRPFPA